LLKIISDSRQALAAFEQNLAIRDETAKLIMRENIHAQLSNWYSEWHRSNKHCVILGDEGDGKTWAVVHWLSDQMTDQKFPPVVFIPSGEVDTKEPGELVAAAINRNLDRTSELDWRRRIEKWLNRPPGDSPLFLLVLDGLNERPSGPWPELFANLNATPWDTKIAVLITCRKIYWHEHLASQTQRLGRSG
jgi:hypothetical protein